MTMEMTQLAMKEIVLNGDRFLLSIPSVDLWNQMLQYIRTGLVDMKEWERLCLSYLYTFSDDKTNIYEYSWDERAVLRYVSNAATPYNPTKDSNAHLTLKFRPVLIPLTRDGEQDLSFAQLEHTMLEGGFLELTKYKNVKARRNTTFIGHAERPYVWAGFKAKTDSLVLVDTCDNEKVLPLRWWVCNGVLVCQQALIQIELGDMFNMGLIPHQNTAMGK